MDDFLSLLTPEQRNCTIALRSQAEQLLDYTPRFRYFTLHGTAHIGNLFELAAMFMRHGLKLTRDEVYLLACSICIHDLGMVLPLKDLESTEVFGGIPQPTDPPSVENRIRDLHHELLDTYFVRNTDFLAAIGLTPAEMSLIREISRGHRRIDLMTQQGHARSIGALLRIIDELDIGANRAPQNIIRSHHTEFDATSCWHWFKHNIVSQWSERNTVFDDKAGRITFLLAVHPSLAEAIPYWLNQIRRPIHKALYDENCARIVRDTWGFDVTLDVSQDQSSASPLDSTWCEIEAMALSAGRRAILVADDEVRKMEDLFIPLMDKYHIIYAPNAKDALDKLAAAHVDLVIVDLQMGSGHIWSAETTGDYKHTGWKLCREINRLYPRTHIGILSGSRHAIDESSENVRTVFRAKKPIDPEEFERMVRDVLG